MKGYITNGVCYIFPQEAAQIPEVEADVFYVQQEDYAAWLAANESLADKLVKYNYNILAVKPKPFAGHTDDDLEPTQKADPELSWSEEAWEVTIGADDNIYAELRNPHSVSPIAYSSSDTAVATINESTGEVTLVAAGVTNLQASFAGDDTYEAQAVTYALTVNAAEQTTYVFDIYITCTDGAIYSQSYAEGDEVNYTFNQSFTSDAEYSWDWTMIPSDLDYTFSEGTPASVDDSDPDNPVDIPEVPGSISFIMPAEAVEFTLTQVAIEPEPDPENPE